MSAADLVATLVRAKNANFVHVSSATILYLDYLLTFDWEVSLIWDSPWSAVKVLFLLTRYIPFMDVTTTLYYQITPGVSPTSCVISGRLAPASITVGIILAETLLAIRTWSLCRCSTMIALVFIATGLGCFIPAIIAVKDYIKTIQYLPSPVPTVLPCLLTKRDNLYIAYALVLAFEAVILGFTAVAGVAAYRQSKSHFVKVVFKDGVLYYVYLGALSLVNIIMILLLPTGYDYLLVFMHRVLHSILACRVIFHLRAEGNRGWISTTENKAGSTSINFNHPTEDSTITTTP
ncbi:hypothetical protein AMATHDRAFT_64730 [Amanita thiersii Skay4041]|uniref:DUF6533 domain-containing protein n=1 Tax=Amanita thiersii Skay4041 TaxID=703135 RepID=A0A2A9NF74_9AGAR|nr:hypothetical protein AMATHDRAFT_64730 [Amanita thiersii Skay4041]